MKFGICDLTIIPMKIEPSDQSEMINQVLFGEYFEIIEESGEWIKILLNHDNYKGWICKKQCKEIDSTTFEELRNQNPTFSADILDTIQEKNYQIIVIGSILPNYKSGHIIINQNMFKFDGLTTQGYIQKKYILETASMYLNTPYLWGGRSPLGIDCSGFTQMVYRLQGIKLPRDSYQQAEIGKTVKLIKESKLGDLAFFKKENKINHVGIIMKNNHIIHASGKVRIDTLDEKGIINSESKKYTHRLSLIKRL